MVRCRNNLFYEHAVIDGRVKSFAYAAVKVGTALRRASTISTFSGDSSDVEASFLNGNALDIASEMDVRLAYYRTTIDASSSLNCSLILFIADMQIYNKNLTHTLVAKIDVDDTASSV